MKNLFSASILMVIVLQLSTFNGSAQESTLWMRNGKKVLISDYKIDTADYYEGMISYTTIEGKNLKNYKENVFSITEFNGKETVLYEPNEDFGEILTREQMKDYIGGFTEARYEKISPFIFIGAVAVGFSGVFVPQPNVETGGNSMAIPVGILLPTAYVGLMGATTPNADKLEQKIQDKDINDYYLMGYQEGIKKKRVKNSLLGAGIGIISGFLLISVVN
ncbi:MAG: hypothetical protein PF517_09985 [Salinivirgaceae bacterium]|jgi:hypothetical protein|nr:hypothetical protein [Salinivirgaceae bacterium]